MNNALLRFQGFLEGKISTLEGVRLTMVDTATLNAYKEMRDYLNRIIKEETSKLPRWGEKGMNNPETIVVGKAQEKKNETTIEKSKRWSKKEVD